MNKDEELIKKVLQRQIREKSEAMQKVINSFKKLHFDMKRVEDAKENSDGQKQPFYSLTRDTFHSLIEITFLRYASKTEGRKDALIEETIDETAISIEYELKPFLKSCGNTLSAEEIELMLHLVEDADLEDGVITLTQIRDLWGVMIYFSKISIEDLLTFVIMNYFEEKRNLRQYRKEKKEIELDTDSIGYY